MKKRCSKCRGTKTMLGNGLIEKPCDKCDATGFFDPDKKLEEKKEKHADVSDTNEDFKKFCKEHNIEFKIVSSENMEDWDKNEKVLDADVKNPTFEGIKWDVSENPQLTIGAGGTVFIDPATKTVPIVNISSSDNTEEVRTKTLEDLSQFKETPNAPKPRRGRPPKGTVRT